MRAGLLAAFTRINENGGVGGREIILISRDDGYEPDRAVKNTNSLISDDQVFALIGAVGTPTSKAVAPIITDSMIPFFAPFTGAEFLRKPVGRLTFDDNSQPFSPSAPLKSFDINSIKIDQRIEKAHSDTDLKAADAVIDLYGNGQMVSRLQRAFSVGAFGVGKRRKFVPTRWSITAIDDTLGKNLLQRTRDAPIIQDFEVYEAEELDNRWAVLMMPTTWRYELIEAWYPRSVWNPYGRGIQILSDWEFYKPRKTYAKIGGCYYAARLAVNENLTARNRQAGVVIFREAHAGYIMPVGVWNVRENVRSAVRKKPSRFGTLKEALDHIQTKMDIPMKRWINSSGILKDTLYQRRLEDFLAGDGNAEPDMEVRDENHGSEGQHSLEPIEIAWS